MFIAKHITTFADDEDGGVLVYWAMALAAFLGLLGLTFDFGRLATTQSELQSYADSVAIAAAAELDGRSDALTRAERAAQNLISDTQTFGNGDTVLSGVDAFTLTYYAAAPDGGFDRDTNPITDSAAQARFAAVDVTAQEVTLGFTAASAALTGAQAQNAFTSARAVGQFSLEACDVAPIAVCLPSVNFSADAAVGQTLELEASTEISLGLPGTFAALESVTDLLDGLNICAGLLGNALSTCLLAAREPATECTPQGGLTLSADVSVSDLSDALNTRFGMFDGVASGFEGLTDFSPAPNVLSGLTDALGVCLPDLGAPSQDTIGLPSDDCIAAGSCSVQGDGSWVLGRQAYVDAHYEGVDPFPAATTRYAFYRAEVEAAANAAGNTGGGLLGGLLGGALGGEMCSPFDDFDPTRRLGVFAGVDCSSLEAGASVSSLPVQQYFEGFFLGPITDGSLAIEVTACLGGSCGDGELDTEVRDVVRLVE